MELGAVPSDHYAGYVDEDSDLEFSDCSEQESSEDEGPNLRGAPVKGAGADSSEDEFEKEMDSEVVGMLEQLTSPTALRALLSREGKLGKKLKDTPGPSPSSILRKSVDDGKSSNDRKSPEHRATKVSKVRFEDESDLPGKEAASSSKPSDSAKEDTSEEQQQDFYDDVYFDSSGSEGEGGEDVGRKVKKLTNEELFYDPAIDDDNERWVQRQRMAYHNVKVSRDLEVTRTEDSADQKAAVHSPTPAAQPPMPRSDAVLNCPACMATLCLDCQRHEVYPTQFRAMFVLNCCIARDETLKYVPKPDRKGRRQRRRKQNSEAAMEGATKEELYHPVRCTECNTEVAVFDKDEVFHFFNVLASRP